MTWLPRISVILLGTTLAAVGVCPQAPAGKLTAPPNPAASNASSTITGIADIDQAQDMATIQSPDQAEIPDFPTMPIAQGNAVPTIGNRRLELFQSNALGMVGPSLWSIAPSDGRAAETALLDPGSAGDQAAWRVVNGALGKAAGAWVLLTVRGSYQDLLLEWRRLLGRENPGQSVNFKVFSRYPGGGVKDEQEYHDGSLWRSVNYDAKGNVVREYRYVDDAKDQAVLSEFVEYRRNTTALLEMSVRGPDGKLRQAIAYDYTLDGRVRQTEKLYPDGHRERFLFRYGTQGLEESWQDDTRDGIHWIFDGQGRLTRQEEWQAGVETRRVVLTWVAAQGNRLASRETLNLAENQSLLEVFDESNRVVQVDDLRNNELYGRTSQVWNDDNTLAQRQSQVQGRQESWLWEYQGGQKTLERYSKDGVPVRVTKYQGKDRSDELYLDGKPILRVFYRDNHRYKEEELRNGQIVRTRTFK